jgi:hypothetical protein
MMTGVRTFAVQQQAARWIPRVGRSMERARRRRSGVTGRRVGGRWRSGGGGVRCQTMLARSLNLNLKPMYYVGMHPDDGTARPLLTDAHPCLCLHRSVVLASGQIKSIRCLLSLVAVHSIRAHQAISGFSL